ncbi:Na+/H+ antiporter NhaA [Pedobacter sp. HMF7647]|uniref:Na(+)/H(+) antiporter NhaA n=1 Tax=Hufsiella arboris TaxID=2695275 RepID=A0A7K1YCL5_9SPHI|nr:Na+/H+ antiporter NhaA [Hufsiella arboris]MXV52315.1 Na+/H+ antiporter NhaA [Hufsiella arboris]
MAVSFDLNRFREFFRSASNSGIILIACVIISITIANTSLANTFKHLLETQFGGNPFGLHLRYSVEGWINDGLMAVFFLLVGLEIKREIVEGELSEIKKAALPVFAALGGMLMPAIIYYGINRNSGSAQGWGIPMATDIAFVLAIIALLGKKVPYSMRIFTAALAIVDDLGAIIVIAVFYTSKIQFDYLLGAAGALFILVLMNRLGVKNIILYLVPGIILWYLIHNSGIHATISGVLLALTIPTNPEKKASPLEFLEHKLHIPVNFIIMPIFALANTNIHFNSKMLDGLTSPLGLGIIAGLLLGKPIGVSLFSWLAVKLKLSVLPENSQWKHIIGISILAGIGFTMSVFISLLSFKEIFEFQEEAKFAILLASLLSGVLGFIYFSVLSKKESS